MIVSWTVKILIKVVSIVALKHSHAQWSMEFMLLNDITCMSSQQLILSWTRQLNNLAFDSFSDETLN